MKVKLHPLGDTYFYNPDAMIACDPTDAGHGWRERPTALFEITSEDTRRIDVREKRLGYLQLASLQAYVRIEQIRPEVILDTRTADGWKTERLVGLNALLRLSFLDSEIALAELYERLAFPSNAHG